MCVCFGFLFVCFSNMCLSQKVNSNQEIMVIFEISLGGKLYVTAE